MIHLGRTHMAIENLIVIMIIKETKYEWTSVDGLAMRLLPGF